MLGFGTTRRLIGKSGWYGSSLFPSGVVVLGIFPYGGFDLTSSDNDSCWVLSAEVVPIYYSADSTSISTFFGRRLDKRVSDRVAEVEAMCGESSCD